MDETKERLEMLELLLSGEVLVWPAGSERPKLFDAERANKRHTVQIAERFQLFEQQTVFLDRGWTQTTRLGVLDKFLAALLDGLWGQLSGGAFNFQSRGVHLGDLPVPGVQRFPDSLAGNVPIHPNRAKAFDIFTAA